MPQILEPIFEKNIDQKGELVKKRLSSIFLPLQGCTHYTILLEKKRKESDFISFALNPIIDLSISQIFWYDFVAHTFNAIASLAKGLYLWSINQQNTKGFIDGPSLKELGLAVNSIDLAITAFLYTLNVSTAISIISLFTRPMATIIQSGIDTFDKENYIFNTFENIKAAISDFIRKINNNSEENNHSFAVNNTNNL